jgi:hypothetical protein
MGSLFQVLNNPLLSDIANGMGGNGGSGGVGGPGGRGGGGGGGPSVGVWCQDAGFTGPAPTVTGTQGGTPGAPGGGAGTAATRLGC